MVVTFDRLTIASILLQTKEMTLGPLNKKRVSPETISNQTVQQVTSYKLLGVTVINLLRWGDQSKNNQDIQSKRLWFLKKLTV